MKTFAGENAANSPRFGFDLTTPILQGMQLAGQQEQRRAIQEQKRLEQQRKIYEQQVRIDPKAQHASKAAEVKEKTHKYLDYVLDPSVPDYAKDKAMLDIKQDIENDYVISQGRLAREKDPTILVDPEMRQYFSAGRNQEADQLRKKRYEAGEYFPALDDYENAAVKKIDVKSELLNNYGFEKNPLLYIEDKSLRREEPFGAVRAFYKINPQVATQVADEFLGIQGNLENVVHGQSRQQYLQNRKIIDSQHPDADPYQKMYLAAQETVKGMIGSHSELYKDSKSIVNVNTGDSSTGGISATRNKPVEVKKRFGDPADPDSNFDKANSYYSVTFSAPFNVSIPSSERIRSANTGEKLSSIKGKIGSADVTIGSYETLMVAQQDITVSDPNSGFGVLSFKKGEIIPQRYAEDKVLKPYFDGKYKVENLAYGTAKWKDDNGDPVEEQIYMNMEDVVSAGRDKQTSKDDRAVYDHVVKAAREEAGSRNTPSKQSTTAAPKAGTTTSTNNTKAPTPTYPDWQKKNPGKTLADYRKLYPKQ